MLKQSQINNCVKAYLPFVLIVLVLFSGLNNVLSHQNQDSINGFSDASLKVAFIMKMYQCNNPQIYQAIMNTFDPVLVATVIAIESGYRVDAVSPAGARGLMQLTPEKLKDWRDVSKNIQVGAEYLKEQLERFGNVELALAAYNAGPTSVLKHRGVPPYKETLRHVKKAKLLLLVLGEPRQFQS